MRFTATRGYFIGICEVKREVFLQFLQVWPSYVLFQFICVRVRKYFCRCHGYHITRSQDKVMIFGVYLQQRSYGSCVVTNRIKSDLLLICFIPDSLTLYL